MSGTITIRLNARSAKALRERAQAERRSASEIVRSLIEREIEAAAEEEETAWERSRRFVGSIHSGPVVGGRNARAALEAWKPDRRG